MKNKILTLGMITMFLSITSCSDNEPSITPIEPGTEINFGSTLEPTTDVQSRTYYGDPTPLNGKTVWPIYWNPSSNPDHIYIYSPEANPGRNQASFTVVRNEDDLKQAAQIKKDGAYGIQASDKTVYNFYGLYPASAVTSPATGTTINGNLPGAQTAVFTGTNSSKDAPAVTTAPTPTATAEYYFKPDMSACLMTAEEPNINLNEVKTVNMKFKPFSTCIDITINGPETNTTTGATTVHVTEVRLISKTANLSGEFTYNFADGKVTPTKGTKTIAIDTKVMDSDGDMIGVPLMSGNKLHLQAFILPLTGAELNDLTVQVVTTEEFKTYPKNLVLTHLGKGQINPVSLPTINVDEGTVDYSIWLSQLDPRIYVSEVSLPGASAAFSATLENTNLNKMQTKSLTDLFNAGIRVFQTHVWIENQKSLIDNGNTSIVISVNGSPVSYNGRYLALGDIINDLTNQMESAHSEEFCVLLLSEYNFSGSSFTTSDFYDRLKTALGSAQMQKYIVTDFGPNTTIGDIKGKVLVKYAANSGTSDTNTSDMNSLNGTNSLFNIWTRNSSTQLNYSTMKWASTDGLSNTTSWPGNPSGNNMLYIHSEQTNPINWNRSGNNYNATWDGNMSSQVSAYNTRYNSTNHNIFGMSYLGGAGDSHNAHVISSGTITLTPTDVAEHYNPIWTTATQNVTNKPFGWVVVNMVGTTSTDAVIKKVIDQNARNGFKLNRDRNKTFEPKQSPTGNTQGTTPGGALFGR